MTELDNLIVQLRDDGDPPFSFAQISQILNARYPGSGLTADAVRRVYHAQKSKSVIPDTPASRPVVYLQVLTTDDRDHIPILSERGRGGPSGERFRCRTLAASAD